MSDGDLSQDSSAVWKFVHLDPVLLQMCVTLVTGVLAMFGVTLGEESIKVVVSLAFLAVVVGMQIWTRARTMSKKKVLAYVSDPTRPAPAVIAGEATTAAPAGIVLDAVRSTPTR